MNKDLIRKRSTGIAFWARRNVHLVYPVKSARQWFELARQAATREGDKLFVQELTKIEDGIIN